MTRIEEIPYMTAEVYSPQYGGKRYPIPDMMGEIADMRNIEDSFDYVVSHLECADQSRVLQKAEKVIEQWTIQSNQKRHTHT